MRRTLLALALAGTVSGAVAMDWGDWIKMAGTVTAAPAAGDMMSRATNFMDGNRLQQDRQNNRALFLTYVMGVVDGQNGRAGPLEYCLPIGVTVGQLSDVVGKELDEAPQRRHFSAAIIVAGAIASAFPCAQAAPSR